MLRGALPALDLSSVLQVVIVLLFTLSGALLLVKRAASRYFVVDASFEVGSSGYEPRRGGMSIGGGDRGGRGPGTGGGDCAACGKLGSKRCSRCKGVQYCSIECQTKHWKAGHKFECKQLKSSEADKVEIVTPGNESCRRRKSSGFSSIALVPAHGTPVRGTCNILQEPKKILFPYDEFVKLFNWDNPGFPPCGLLNCGNSCFANVVLQCLASTRPLAAYLLERDHIRECVRKHNDWCFLCELQVHLKRSSESRHPFSPINILSRLPNIGGTLGYGRQEDAHEFMRFAIDTMQSICLDEFGGEKVVDPSTQETTLIQYIFGGHLQSQVTCTECNMISNRYENMMDLTVEIHGDAESLEECLDQFTTKEWLDGENKYKCDGCNDYVKAWKRLTVHQAPNILTVALKRFQSGRFGKLNKRVTFPENLNLTPYMSGSNDGTDLYQLYAVVVHVDMLNASFFGHYICYTKDYQGRWYRIDDCKVTEVGVEDVLSEGAYMLLYNRKSARTEPFVKPEEPQKKKQLVEAVPKVANSISLPQDTQSSHLDHSLLGEIKSSDDISSTAKEVDDVDLNDLAVPSHNSIEDLEFCDPSSSSPRAMGLETETSGLYSSLPDNLRAKSVQLDDHPESSPIEIDIDKCLQPCTSYHARNHTVQDTEASTSESDVNMVVEACLTAPMTAKTVVSEPSGYPSAELVSHVETYSSLDSTSEVVNNLDKPSFDEGNKISPSILESKSSRIAEAASSSCFLCKSTESKSLVGVEIQNGTHSVNNEIGQSNGYYMNGIYEVLEKEPLDRRNDVSPADLSSISHVFVQNSIKSSDMKKRGPKKFEHHITSFSNGSSEHVGSQIKDDSRSESHYCNGSDLTQTNQYRILSYGSAGENRNGDCKDRPTTPLTLESNGNLASDQDLKPLPEYVIEHIRLNKAAVSYCNEENGSTPS